MKRIWGLIIALLLLSGCGAQKPVVSETNEPPAQNVPATETTTETTTEATEEAEQFDAAKEKAYEDAVYFFSQFELGRIYAVDPASGETVYDDAAVAALYQTFLRLDGYKDSETYLERFYAVEDVLLRKAVTYIDREGNVSQFPPIRYAYHADGSLWKVMDYQKENGYSDHNLALLDVSGSANEIVFSYEKGSLSEIWVGTDDRTYLQSAVVWNE